MTRPLANLMLCILVSAAFGQVCDGGDTSSTTASPHRLGCENLPNAIQVHANVISGGVPEGDSAFAELATLGIRTIISVDGAKPDVELARKHGIRYVHLPHGYDGIPKQRVLELAKAVRELELPVYVHCHHGKHRSPAAAAVACVTAGLIPESQALSVLRLAGTDENYRGLYQSASRAIAIDGNELDKIKVEYKETAQIPAMAEAMVALEHTQHRLDVLANSNWLPPPSDPDLDAVHEALLLKEHFAELLRADRKASSNRGDIGDAAFKRILQDSESAATDLKLALTRFATQASLDVTQEIEIARKRIAENCKSCHQQFRDVPRDE